MQLYDVIDNTDQRSSVSWQLVAEWRIQSCVPGTPQSPCLSYPVYTQTQRQISPALSLWCDSKYKSTDTYQATDNKI